MRQFMYVNFFVCITFFLSCNKIFSFVSTTSESLLYSEIVSFQNLQVSTKSYLDTEISFYYPEKTSYSDEKVTTGFFNYVEYIYWMDNPALLSPKVYPAKSLPGNSFEFSCVYYDNDPVAFGYPKVRIYRDNTEIVGSPFSLNYTSGSLDTGILFSTHIVLSLPSNNYKFYFYAYDIYNFYTQTEYICGPVVNTPPQVAPPLQAAQPPQNNTVEPDFGTESTTFYFKVVYIDADNHPPVSGYPKLYILKQNDVVQALPMQYQTGLYTTGAVYTAKTCLPLGEYNYYFVAKDNFDEQSNILYSSKSIIVNGNCKIELVSYPTEIEPNEDFVVYLRYTDIGADPPDSGYPKIVFYLNNELIHTGLMEYVQGSFGTGAVYVYSIKFSTVSANYSFVCYAKDNTGLWPVVQTTTNSFVVSTLPSKPESHTVYQNNNSNVSVSGKITLKWHSTDPDPDSTITYQLYFGDNLNNMKKIYEGTNTEYTVCSLEDGKMYYWYVVAIDNTGRKSQSKVYSFNTISVDENRVFNYPNPVNAKKQQKTNIVFYSDTDGSCEIYISTLFGEMVFKDTIQVYKGSNVYEYTPEKELKSGSYAVVVKIGNKIKKGYILVLNK